MDIYSGARGCLESAERQACSEQLAYPSVPNGIPVIAICIFFLYVYEIRNKWTRLHSQSPSALTISPHFGQIEGREDELRKVCLYIRSPIYPSFLFI